MLDRPDVSDEAIARRIRDEYGFDVRSVNFLAVGADADAAAFRIECADRVLFAKLRRGTDRAAMESSVALLTFLAEARPTNVLAPLPTTAGRFAVEVDGHDTILFPFVQGTNGFDAELSHWQWIELGRTLAAVHCGRDRAVLSPLLAKQIRVEDFSSKWRDRLRGYLAAPDADWPTDEVAQELLGTLRLRGADLARILARAQELAAVMAAAANEFVLCHGDIHAGNVMLTAEGALFVIDWDNPVIAPRERDLMYIGAGIGAWSDDEDFAPFYQGYGPIDVDPVGIAYYRCERIVEDSALFCADIMAVDAGGDAGGEDRAQNLRYFLDQFRPGSVIDCADAAYDRIRLRTMHESFVNLRAKITPVRDTDAGEPVDWVHAMEEWGPLPTDYVDFVTCFGAGTIGRDVWILAPLSIDSDGTVSFSDGAPDAAQLEVLNCPFPAFPEPGGLLCWGGTEAGDYAFWRTEGDDPDQWTTVLWRRQIRPEWREYSCGIAELLLKTTRREWDRCPFSESGLWGAGPMEFLSFHAETWRLRHGIQPWSGKPDPTFGTFG